MAGNRPDAAHATSAIRRPKPDSENDGPVISAISLGCEQSAKVGAAEAESGGLKSCRRHRRPVFPQSPYCMPKGQVASNEWRESALSRVG